MSLFTALMATAVVAVLYKSLSEPQWALAIILLAFLVALKELVRAYGRVRSAVLHRALDLAIVALLPVVGLIFATRFWYLVSSR